MIGQIELTEAEQEIANQIVFDHSGSVSLEYEEVIANGELAAALMESLLTRKAIPESRERYFADRECNISNSKASPYELFLRESRTAEKMYRHPHFLKYLHYFVFGADLPETVKEAFLSRFNDSDGSSEQLVQLARKQVRDLYRVHNSQDYRYPDAFYQMALDCGCEQWDARSVRDAVKAVKKN